MDFIQQLLLLLAGGLFSSTVIGSVLFYRHNRRAKEVANQKAVAEVEKTEAETEKIRAMADDVSITALSAAITALQGENKRLGERFESLHDEVCVLRARVTKVVEENDVLKDRLHNMHLILVDFQRGISMLLHQVCEAELEPAYSIPDTIKALIDEEAPPLHGRGNPGG